MKCVYIFSIIFQLLALVKIFQKVFIIFTYKHCLELEHLLILQHDAIVSEINNYIHGR